MEEQQREVLDTPKEEKIDSKTFEAMFPLAQATFFVLLLVCTVRYYHGRTVLV